MALMTDIRGSLPNSGRYTFFSSAHRTVSTRDYRVGHKMSLNKFTKTKRIFSDHNEIELEFNNRKKI